MNKTNCLIEKEKEKSINMAYMSMVQSLGYDIKMILNRQDIETVAIYGMGEEGIALYYLLSGSGINICYVSDQRFDDLVMPDVSIINPKCVREYNVDLIIVSSNYYYEDIRNELKKTVTGQICSARVLLENILMCCNRT